MCPISTLFDYITRRLKTTQAYIIEGRGGENIGIGGFVKILICLSALSLPWEHFLSTWNKKIKNIHLLRMLKNSRQQKIIIGIQYVNNRERSSTVFLVKGQNYSVYLYIVNIIIWCSFMYVQHSLKTYSNSSRKHDLSHTH